VTDYFLFNITAVMFVYSCTPCLCGPLGGLVHTP